MTITFGVDDGLYEDWVERNPSGYVVNTGLDMPLSYMVLHRAGCPKFHD
jgi:hypothetical protein